MSCMHTVTVVSDFHVCTSIGELRKASERGDAPDLSSRVRVLYVCFFLVGIGMSMTWGAISFPVHLWTAAYGKMAFTVFVAAYNLPGLPFILLQLYLDQKRETPATYTEHFTRVATCLVTLVLVTALVPIIIVNGAPEGLTVCLIVVVGFAVAGMYSWVFSLAAIFPPLCTSWLIGGVGAAPLVLLAIQLGDGFTGSNLNDPSASRVYTFFEASSIVGAFGLLSFCFLMTRPLVKARFAYLAQAAEKPLLDATDSDSVDPVHFSSKDPFGSYMPPGGADDTGVNPGNNAAGPAGLATNNAPDSPASRRADSGKENDLTLVELTKLIWGAGLAVLFVNISLVAVAGLTAVLPSSSHNPSLPTIVLYVASISLFIGSELAVVFPKVITTSRQSFVWASARMLLFVWIIVYAKAKFWLNDDFILFVFSIFAVTGGFINASSYSVASGTPGIPSHQKGLASNVMNVMVYSGVFVGIALSFIFASI